MRHFTDEEAWSGGHYELGIELGGRSDERLWSAIRALWSYPQLSVPWGVIGFETDAETRIEEMHKQPRAESFLLSQGDGLEFLRRDIA